MKKYITRPSVKVAWRDTVVSGSGNCGNLVRVVEAVSEWFEDRSARQVPGSSGRPRASRASARRELEALIATPMDVGKPAPRDTGGGPSSIRIAAKRHRAMARARMTPTLTQRSSRLVARNAEPDLRSGKGGYDGSVRYALSNTFEPIRLHHGQRLWSSCGAERMKRTEAQRRTRGPKMAQTSPNRCNSLPSVADMVRRGSTVRVR